MRPALIVLAILLAATGCQTTPLPDSVIPDTGVQIHSEAPVDEPTPDDPPEKPAETTKPATTDGVKPAPVESDGDGAVTPEADAVVVDDITTVPDSDGPPAFSETQQTLLAAGREILQTQSTFAHGVTYSYDCSGTILTIYAHAGIYLVELFPRYSGNGVARLHGIAAEYELLHTQRLPEPGDLIFWDNTYDRNNDGQWNDPLTHAGFVLSVSDDGTVEFLHHNYRRGIVTATMNLLDPNTHVAGAGEEVNSPMRMASQRASNPDLWLSSHLFREFASMHLIELDLASIHEAGAVALAR